MSPHFSLAAGKQVPGVARGAAGAGRCLRVVKASFVLLKAPSWGGLVLPQHGLSGDGFLLCLHTEMCQCCNCVITVLPRPEILWEPH